MFFFPYRIDSRKAGLPILTVLICIVCAFIYWQQYKIDNQYYQALEKFCYTDLSKREIAWINKVPFTGDISHCQFVLESIREAENSESQILQFSKQIKPVKLFASKQENLNYTTEKITEIYKRFDREVPESLTDGLAYDPHELNIVKMLTSTFSHGDIFHLLGNLLFFYIFAASVELIIGHLAFTLFIILTTFGTSLAYSYAMAGVEAALPTIGLSGVVMATVAALAVMMPRANIRCFFWFLVFFRIFRIPALLIALWYIGWDIYEMNDLGNDSYINYTAHVSGAAMGAFLGGYYLVFRKSLLAEAADSY